jgi:hypothetical protein
MFHIMRGNPMKKAVLLFTMIALLGLSIVIADNSWSDRSTSKTEADRIVELKQELSATSDQNLIIELRQEMGEVYRSMPDRRPPRDGELDQGGENCDDANDLTGNPLPIVVVGSTVGFLNDFSAAGLGPINPPCWIGYYDELLSCAGADVVYSYTVPFDGDYLISLCGSNFDTGLLIYQNTCPLPPSNPADFLCGNDDLCGLESELVVPLIAGESILIVVDGYDVNEGDYQLLIDLNLTEPPPLNDECVDAEYIEPFSIVNGTTIDATFDPAPDCGTAVTAPGVWYAVFGTGNTLTASTCLFPDYDTKLNVYTGDCSLLECVDGNDDACGLQSEVSWCSIAGEPYYILVQGFGGQTGNFELSLFDDGLPCTNEVYRIPEIYANIDLLDGTVITVEAHGTNDEAGILVDDAGIWELNERMPPNFYLTVADFYLPPEFWDGVLLQVTGRVTLDPTGEPGENILISELNAPGPLLAPGGSPSLTLWRPAAWVPSATCDNCKFAILISGGINAGNNNQDYWEDLNDFYCYKRANEWCENRTKVFYYKGTRRDNRIPTAVVDSAKKSLIQAHITAISSQIAQCVRDGECPQMEIMVTNHGKHRTGAANRGGINLLDNNVLYPTDFTAMMQTLVDSGLCVLDAEFGQCYGGQMVDSLRANLNAKQCNVTAASATDDAHTTTSKRIIGGYNRWLNPKVCSLYNGGTIQEAIRHANRTYDSVMVKWANWRGDWSEFYRARGGAGDAARATSARAGSTAAMTGLGKGQYFRAFQCTTRCHAETLQVKPGGRITLTWSGDAASCGNAEILCQDTSDGEFRRAASWNWNVPGSSGFEAGNNTRQLTSDSSHTGLYVLHSRTLIPFNIKATSQNPPISTTDPSNPETFSGFSVGWRSGNSDEFGNIVALLHGLPDADADGFSLGTSPKIIGPSGVQILVVGFEVVQENFWWESMELYFTIVNAPPGAELSYSCPDCEVPNGTVTLSGGPEGVLFNVGSINIAGSHSLTITSASDIELDCWGLESGQSTAIPPEVADLTVIRSGDDIVLNWSAVPLAVSYLIQTASTSDGLWSDLNTTVSTTYTHANQVLAGDEILFYRVIAVGP